MSHPNFTVHIRETWKGPGAQRPSFIAKPHHNLKRLFEVCILHNFYIYVVKYGIREKRFELYRHVKKKRASFGNINLCV